MSTVKASPLDKVPALAGKKPIWKRLADPKVAILLVAFLVIWKIASTLMPGYNVPKISDVASHLKTTVTTADGLQNLFTTLGRVGFGLVCSFVVGLLMGLLAGANSVAAGYLLPVVRFIQGIPALSWVIIAVIWFANVDSDQGRRVQGPSLGAFLPAVIKDRKLDAKNGLDLEFTFATPDNYNSEFGAGHYDVGGSAAVLSEALRTQRGADVTYLFNLFDFYGTVVTSDSAIKGLGDLKGHTMAAATGTTNYAMFAWFAKQAGLDLKGVQTQNQTTAGLSTMALTGRTDATQLWEPAYSTLVAKKPAIHTIDLDYASWNSQFGTSEIPYLGVAAQSSWATKNPDQVKALYQTYKDAADWVTKNHSEAAAVIAKTIPGGDAKVVQQLIEASDQRLRMHVTPANAVSDGMKAVFKAGQQTGYLTKEPPSSVIYSGLK